MGSAPLTAASVNLPNHGERRPFGKTLDGGPLPFEWLELPERAGALVPNYGDISAPVVATQIRFFVDFGPS